MTTQLNKQDNIESVFQWLNDNLIANNSIIPQKKDLIKVPKNKGIYFWFMHLDGYKILSKFIKLSAIEKRYTKKFNDVEYHLVYLGTAGTRNNESGINNGHLRGRLNWHIKLNKNESSICSGTMSTFRRTIGPLIADDLIENNTQNKIDDLFKKYFRIIYIAYPGSFLDVKDLINLDETILIDSIRPLFNLDENENVYIREHLTSLIGKRRKLIEKSTKTRLGCSKNQKPIK